MSRRSIAIHIEERFGVVIANTLSFRVAVAVETFKFSFSHLIAVTELSEDTRYRQQRTQVQKHFWMHFWTLLNTSSLDLPFWSTQTYFFFFLYFISSRFHKFKLSSWITEWNLNIWIEILSSYVIGQSIHLVIKSRLGPRLIFFFELDASTNRRRLNVQVFYRFC